MTPQDYVEIQQLVARYPYALDGGLDRGRAYADLFSDDGEFHQQPTSTYPNGRVWKGRQELLTSANTHHYEGVYVKIPAGWRFKSRTVVNQAPTTGGREASSRSQSSAQPAAR